MYNGMLERSMPHERDESIELEGIAGDVRCPAAGTVLAVDAD